MTYPVPTVGVICLRGDEVLLDYAARWISGEPMAGDDAAEARFVSRDEAMALVEWDETRRVIAETYERFSR
jgi:8-oxo-dGTP diphosphatase